MKQINMLSKADMVKGQGVLSAHDEQVENLVGTEIFMPGVENGQFQGVDDAAQGVNNAAGQKPEKPGFRKGADDLGDGQDAYPAHGNINQRGEPLGAGDPKSVDDDACGRDGPYQS